MESLMNKMTPWILVCMRLRAKFCGERQGILFEVTKLASLIKLENIIINLISSDHEIIWQSLPHPQLPNYLKTLFFPMKQVSKCF